MTSRVYHGYQQVLSQPRSALSSRRPRDLIFSSFSKDCCQNPLASGALPRTPSWKRLVLTTLLKNRSRATGQTTDLNNNTTRYYTATALTAFVHYNSACRPLLSLSSLRGGRGVRAVGVATLNANSVKKQSINAKSPNVADWQCLGVDKITRRLEWNSGRKARKGHICEDSLAYASYSSKDVSIGTNID